MDVLGFLAKILIGVAALFFVVGVLFLLFF